MNRRHFGALLLGALFALAPWFASAENSTKYGEFVIHHNAFNASIIQPAVAQQHGIVRSRYQAILNVSVVRQIPGTLGESVPARVSGTATQLGGVVFPLEFREVREGDAVYYLAEFRVDNEQTLNFELQVKPAGSTGAAQIRFTQQFFTE